MEYLTRKEVLWLIEWYKSWEFKDANGNLFKLGDLTEEQLERASKSDNMAYRVGASHLIKNKNILKELGG